MCLRLFTFVFFCISLFPNSGITADSIKTARFSPETPSPSRFIVQGATLVDKKRNAPLFLKGIGYSPYLPNELPLKGKGPGNDDRYTGHLGLIKKLGANYIHLFPSKMPENFFNSLDKTDLLYGQDIFVWAYENDFLDDAFQEKTLKKIREVIDYTYRFGRPDRLILFSVGDELQPESIIRTDRKHPQVTEYRGKHVIVTHRTPTEVALAKLIDGGIDYELKTYGRRHLYSHTSWTHVGPIADRKDLEVPYGSALLPDMGDLICLNIYTYARGVRTSPPGSVTSTSYQGYLEELAKSVDKPIFITQVGFSTSPFEPKPWVPGFGGHKIEEVPLKFAQIWKDLHTAQGKEKYCGMSVFELQDEWWKSGDYVEDSTRHELQDPEEWFGLYEIGPNNKLLPKGKIPDAIGKAFHEPLE